MITRCRRKSNILRNQKGSSIIMALVVMTVLILLALAVTTLSMGALKTNAADASNNRAYYAAEAGINRAIEQIKYEVSSYYNVMLDTQTTNYSSLYNNFFDNIKSNTQQHFREPSFDGITTNTTFSIGSVDSSSNTSEFDISCIATAADGASYKIAASLIVKRVNVRGGQSRIIDIDGAAVKAGGTLSLGKKNGIRVNDGDIRTNELTYERSWLPYTISNGNLYLDTSVNQTIHDKLKYETYADPAMSDLDLFITKNNFNIKWSNVPAEPVSISTANGVSIKITSCSVPKGIIHGKGDIKISNCVVYSDIYCDGNIQITNGSVYGNVYCRGNVSGSNANLYGSVIADGSVSFNNGALHASVYAANGILVHNASSSGSLFSPKAITVKQTGVKNGIIYSSSKVNVGNCSINAIVFSGGDIELTGSLSVTGAVIAKSNLYFSSDSNKYITVNYSASTIENILDSEQNRFFSSGSKPSLNANVFTEQTITPIGRIN